MSTPPILFNFSCIPVFLFIFIPHYLKSAGHFGKPSVLKLALSVCPSVCPSVTILFPLSILSTFQQILFKLYIRADIGEEWLGIIDWLNQHKDIALYVEKWFRCFILAHYIINFLHNLNESRYNDLGCYEIANPLISKTT